MKRALQYFGVAALAVALGALATAGVNYTQSADFADRFAGE